MKKHLLSLCAAWLCAASLFAQWDIGLGAGINNYLASEGNLDEQYRLPDGGATIVPSLFVTWQPGDKRWYGIEGFVQRRESWFLDQDLGENVLQQEKGYGLRFTTGNTYMLSDAFSIQTSVGVHGERVAERAYFSRVAWVENNFNDDFGGMRYSRFGLSFEIAGRVHATHLIGLWFLRFEGDVIATESQPFDRNRYIGFTTGLRVPVLSIRKKDLSGE